MQLDALVFLLAAVASVSTEPYVLPKFTQIKQHSSSIVQCSFNHTLTDCRIRVSEHYYSYYDTVMDFRSGPHSADVSLKYSNGQTSATASYAGTGLSSGHCGVELKVVYSGVYLVECFGRSQHGGWSQGFGLLTSSAREVLTLSTPNVPLVLARQGSTETVLLQTQGPWQLCTIKTPNAQHVDLGPGDSPPSGSRYRLHGAGLGAGECGYKVPDIRERDAGVWDWYGEKETTATWQMSLVLVEAAPHGDPKLLVLNPTPLLAGDLLNVTCRSPPSVPPATLTWLLDGRVIRRDDLNDTLPGDLATTRPWDPRPVIQTLARRLTAQDEGKTLECRMDHSALSSYTKDSVVLRNLTSASEANGGCAALSSDSVLARCKLGGKAVNCNNGQAPVGATARLSCRPGYKLPEPHPGSLVAQCTALKRWSRPMFACLPDCGSRKANNAKPLSVGGREAVVSEFPWHVGIFRQRETSYEAICGGTLVTPSFVITAAHCAWNFVGKRAMLAKQFRVAVGKHSRGWETTDPGEQRLQVRTLHLPERFAGSVRSLESDIAVMELATPARLSLDVNVVCMDWDASFEYQHFSSGSNGTVPGWGVTESNSPSNTLRYVDLPFVSFRECHNSVPAAYQSYLTQDKICGGFQGRTTSVCSGDSGGGFVFPLQRRGTGVQYYLRAIVSSAPVRSGPRVMSCQAEHYTAFTSISAHGEWLKAIIFHHQEEDDQAFDVRTGT